MPDLSLDTAKNIAIALVILFVVGGILSAWLIRKVVAKVIAIAIFAVLALAVWSSRDDLQDCVDRVEEAIERGSAADQSECTLFGFTVSIPSPAGG